MATDPERIPRLKPTEAIQRFATEELTPVLQAAIRNIRRKTGRKIMMTKGDPLWSGSSKPNGLFPSWFIYEPRDPTSGFHVSWFPDRNEFLYFTEGNSHTTLLYDKVLEKLSRKFH